MSELRRQVGLSGALFMGLGSIVGTGVFVSMAIAADLVTAWLPFAIAIAALLALANGLSSAQLAATHPVSGGTYEYGYRTINGFVGFTAGFLFLCAKSCSAATAALGIAGYLALLTGSEAQTTSIALGIVLLLTGLVSFGVKKSNVVNMVIVSAAVLGLVTFVLIAASESSPAGILPTAPTSMSAFLEATALMFVAYTGYGRIATLGEEVVDPKRTIPKAMFLTLGAVLFIYLAVGIALTEHISLLQGEEFRSSAPLEIIVHKLAGENWAAIVTFAAAAAMLSVLLNLVLGLSRVVLAMGRRSDLPTGLANIDDTGNPRNATLFAGLVIATLTLIGDVKFAWSLSAFTVLVYYGLTNWCALRLAKPERLFPRWIAAAGLVTCFFLAFWVELDAWLTGLGLLCGGYLWRVSLGYLRKK